MNVSMLPHYWAEAVRDLTRNDPVLRRLIKQYPGVALASRGAAFSTLVRSIVGQQISVKAADSVWSRLSSSLPEMSPDAVLRMAPDALRSCGLSARKVEYISDLAGHFVAGRIHVDTWPEMADAEIIDELTDVRGIGEWTAQMFLMFNLLRPDVLPLDDIGLQKAAALHYFSGQRPTRRQLTELGESWRPWRSVATWYLWRSLDPVPVEY